MILKFIIIKLPLLLTT